MKGHFENVYAYPRIRAVTDRLARAGHWIARKAKDAWLTLRYGGCVLI